MDYATIKQHVSMDRLLDELGIARDNKGRCACPLHGGDNKTAFSVHSQSQGWTCHTKCNASGDIFTFIERFKEVDNSQARILIMEMFNLSDPEPPRKTCIKPPTKLLGTVVSKKRYVYRDKDGEPLYTVRRVDYADGRKDCFQEYQGRPTLPPDVRTLYNLDKIHGNTGDFVCLCEGEKTADALTECGYIGTTNPLGSKSWDAKYAELLRGQKVIVMPDADEHGERWRDEVVQSLQGVVEQVQVINMPDSFIKAHPQFRGHDFADYLEARGKEEALGFMVDATMESQVLPRGVDPALLGRPADDFREIISKAKNGVSSTVFNMSSFIPSMDIAIKRGDVVVLMANTGTGKTRLLHNLPFHLRRLNFVIFDLELSRETLALRYGAMENGCSFNEITRRVESGMTVKPVTIENVFIQKLSRLTVERIRERVNLIESVTGKTIHAVGVDYIGLMPGSGTAYERASNNVEDFKSYISESGKVGILTTQVSRPEHKEDGIYRCPSPFDAKNSGSIENSAQILIGFWRDKRIPQRLWSSVLKYSHGSFVERDIPLNANDLLISEAS